MIWLWGYLCGVILTIMIYGILEALITVKPRKVTRSGSLEIEFCILAVLWPLAVVIGLIWLIANVACFVVVAVVCITGLLKTKGTK